MGDYRWWPAIEYDPNDGRAWDVVTEDFAKGLEVGDEIVAVMIDKVDCPTERDGHTFKMIDDAHAIVCRITKIQPLDKYPGEVLICAEYLPAKDVRTAEDHPGGKREASGG